MKTPNKETEFKCTVCRVTFPIRKTAGTGYANTPAGRVCYACCDKIQLEDIPKTNGPLVAYVSSNGRRIQTWSGGKLMDITQAKTRRLARESYIHGSDCQSYRAVDPQGKQWWGVSSPGIAITLRRVK